MLKKPKKTSMQICQAIAKVRGIRKNVREEWRNNKSFQVLVNNMRLLIRCSPRLNLICVNQHFVAFH